MKYLKFAMKIVIKKIKKYERVFTLDKDKIIFWADSVLPFCSNKYTNAVESAALLIGLRGLKSIKIKILFYNFTNYSFYFSKTTLH